MVVAVRVAVLEYQPARQVVFVPGGQTWDRVCRCAVKPAVGLHAASIGDLKTAGRHRA
jgi:hypothetical protein